jgi:hypothetical protein
MNHKEIHLISRALFSSQLLNSTTKSLIDFQTLLIQPMKKPQPLEQETIIKEQRKDSAQKANLDLIMESLERQSQLLDQAQSAKIQNNLASTLFKLCYLLISILMMNRK